jgi:hypothetical protein
LRFESASASMDSSILYWKATKCSGWDIDSITIGEQDDLREKMDVFPAKAARGILGTSSKKIKITFKRRRDCMTYPFSHDYSTSRLLNSLQEALRLLHPRCRCSANERRTAQSHLYRLSMIGRCFGTNYVIETVE